MNFIKESYNNIYNFYLAYKLRSYDIEEDALYWFNYLRYKINMDEIIKDIYITALKRNHIRLFLKCIDYHGLMLLFEKDFVNYLLEMDLIIFSNMIDQLIENKYNENIFIFITNKLVNNGGIKYYNKQYPKIIYLHKKIYKNYRLISQNSILSVIFYYVRDHPYYKHLLFFIKLSKKNNKKYNKKYTFDFYINPIKKNHILWNKINCNLGNGNVENFI